MTDPTAKPTLSYAAMITNAICSVESKRITLNGIYAYIKDNYAFYRAADPSGWQVSHLPTYLALCVLVCLYVFFHLLIFVCMYI